MVEEKLYLLEGWILQSQHQSLQQQKQQKQQQPPQENKREDGDEEEEIKLLTEAKLEDVYAKEEEYLALYEESKLLEKKIRKTEKLSGEYQQHHQHNDAETVRELQFRRRPVQLRSPWRI